MNVVDSVSSKMSPRGASGNHGSVAGIMVRSYHELGTSHVGGFSGGVTVIDSLKVNLAQLEELHARLSFMMGEVKDLLKK